MSIFTPGVSAGAPSTVTISGRSTPTIVNQTITLANTEYSIVIPSTAKSFLVRTRNGSQLLLAWVSGETVTNYLTVNRHVCYNECDLSLTSSLTLYFQGASAGDVLELLYWT